jgi:hypothetical protein
MQHHGFPNRLLDWSERLAVAAYFVVRDVLSDAEGAVWVLFPQWLYIGLQESTQHINILATNGWNRIS